MTLASKLHFFTTSFVFQLLSRVLTNAYYWGPSPLGCSIGICISYTLFRGWGKRGCGPSTFLSLMLLGIDIFVCPCCFSTMWQLLYQYGRCSSLKIILPISDLAPLPFWAFKYPAFQCKHPQASILSFCANHEKASLLFSLISVVEEEKKTGNSEPQIQNNDSKKGTIDLTLIRLIY